MTKKITLTVFCLGILSYFFIFNNQFNFYSKFTPTSMSIQKDLYIPKINDIRSAVFLSEDNKSKVSLEELLGKNQNAILHFWATWCVPCLEEIPMLVNYALKQNNNSNAPVFIFIAVNDEWVDIQKFLDKKKINYKDIGYWLIDNDNISYQNFRVDKVPESFVIRSNEVERLVGVQQWR